VTTPPANWFDGLLRAALKLLAVAMALYVAASLVLAVLPVLVGAGVAVVVGFVGWVIYQNVRSKW
jgi:hypothetical protein